MYLVLTNSLNCFFGDDTVATNLKISKRTVDRLWRCLFARRSDGQ
jgi:hypothetical protein